MNDESSSTPAGTILTLPNTDPLFFNQSHLFTLIVRKAGANATYGSGLGLDIPNRFANISVLVNIGLFEAPQLTILCAH